MPVKKGQALGFIHHERMKYGCKDRGLLLLKQYHKHGIFLAISFLRRREEFVHTPRGRKLRLVFFSAPDGADFHDLRRF
jgi:hypothetical protein